MNIMDFAVKNDFHVLTNPIQNKEVTGIYVSDLLSWAMARVQKGNIWITVHTNLNVVAVAALTEASCIIIPEDIEVDEATVKKAREQDVCIIGSKLSAYDICITYHEYIMEQGRS